MKLMSNKEVKSMQEMMRQQFGTFLRGIFFITGKGKVYLTTEYVKKAVKEIGKIEGVGLYIGRINKDGFRPSIEGAQLLNPKKGIIELFR